MINKHGHSMYKNSGCRCDTCRAGAAAYMREYREQNREAINARRRELYAAKKAALNILPNQKEQA